MVEDLKFAKKITGSFQLLSVKIKMIKEKEVLLVFSSPLDKECPVAY